MLKNKIKKFMIEILKSNGSSRKSRDVRKVNNV